ncbi:hypothetical protein ACFVZ3_06625 [Kitasatospora purpeofusca]|uniref:hypothetical protein n=1 Tax=Kitasatospora purpeofusca TaxID=67352 RepID=UPI0036556D7D
MALERFLPRAAVSLAGAACLAAVTVTPAHAAFPSKGRMFQIRTVFEGQALCATAERPAPHTVNHRFSHCDKSKPIQQWRISNNGRQVVNAAESECFPETDIRCQLNRRVPPDKLMWQQDSEGRVFWQIDKTDRDYWLVVRNNGIPQSFTGTSYHNTPRSDAAVFTFPVV